MAFDELSNENTNNEINNPQSTPEEAPQEEAKAVETEQTPTEQSTPEESNAQEIEQKPEESSRDNATEEKPQDTPSEEKPKETISEEKPKETPSLENSEEVNAKKQHFDEVYAKLKQAHENNESIEIDVNERRKGGLSVSYDGIPLFLPASHFSLYRNPSEDAMNEVVGQKLEVKVHEYQEDEFGRVSVIVSRKRILEETFWDTINVGDIVEGKVSSIASFGVFIDLGGIEGLIHISRLSKVHIDDPKNFVNKGDTMKAVVVDINREKSRIALSHKEMEASPWKGAEEEFPAGSKQKGIVRRLTDFGAYVELKPGVDGLLRLAELSWTKRIKKPSDVVEPNQEIDIEIVNISEERENATLSLKRTTENPWEKLKEIYPIGKELPGTVNQVMAQGAIVTIGEDDYEVDGFMPRSKLKPIMKGKKIPYNIGDKLDVTIADLVADEETLILAPKISEEQMEAMQKERNQRRPSRRPAQQSSSSASSSDSAFTLGDLISENQKKNLFNNLDDK